ncbi:uncharacterized protein LOC133885099 [Phragmites australis]|uniref:uncharacterized protein LOC133885099 n=1 Tax=Phragmites australis TaxID=29695 RepID=UPI002D79D416|nr:uncharacterized protein LOC133885099 [Phragmites australis]
MGTEVLRPHDCLARARDHARRPLRTAGKTAPGQSQGARRDRRAFTPREVRVKVAVADAYAGPAFAAMSPSPQALPLPRFSSRTAGDAAVPGVDDSATRELRRLLGLH